MVYRSKKRSIVDGHLASAFSKKLLFLFLLSILMISLNAFSAFAIEGCYLYAGGSPDFVCQSVDEVAAEADYLEIVGDTNDFNTFFVPGSTDCETEFSDICRPVTCSTSCSTESIAACELSGGQEVPDNEFDLWCSAGCCTVGEFCNFVSTRDECIQQAGNQGVTFQDSHFFKIICNSKEHLP